VSAVGKQVAGADWDFAVNLLPGERPLADQSATNLMDLERQSGLGGCGVELEHDEEIAVVVQHEHFVRIVRWFVVLGAERAGRHLDEAPENLVGGGDVAIAGEQNDAGDPLLPDEAKQFVALSKEASP
jgi:hypothetical protein